MDLFYKTTIKAVLPHLSFSIGFLHDAQESQDLRQTRRSEVHYTDVMQDELWTRVAFRWFGF